MYRQNTNLDKVCLSQCLCGNMPETAKRTSHCVSWNLSWRCGIGEVVWMFAFSITVFRRTKGICPVTRAFIYIYGRRVGEERLLLSGWDDYHFLLDQEESSDQWGLESSSVMLNIQTSWSCLWAQSHSARIVVKQPPWMGKTSLPLSHCLEPSPQCPAAHVGVMTNAPCWKRSSGKRTFLGGRTRLHKLWENRNANTHWILVFFSSSAFFYPALIISILWMYFFLLLFLL